VYDAIKGADLVLHAGDFVELDLLEKLQELKKVVAVCGNMDSRPLRDMLKPKEVVSAGKFKIGLCHGHGAPAELIKTVRAEFGKVDAIVFGHSHRPVNVLEDGILFFNPGSPTDKVFAPYNSYGVLNVADDGIKGEIIRL
jgi:putative phosphoesterase